MALKSSLLFEMDKIRIRVIDRPSTKNTICGKDVLRKRLSAKKKQSAKDMFCEKQVLRNMPVRHSYYKVFKQL